MHIFVTIVICGLCGGFCIWSAYKLILAIKERRKKKRSEVDDDRKEGNQ